MQNYGAFGAIRQAIKRKVFLSYHHGGDRAYYDLFVKTFAENYEVFADNSPERAIESDDADYVRWALSQNNITGSSCTILLCGAETPGRKFVDWEIKNTLDKKHGLLGIGLPTAKRTLDNKVIVPDRFNDDYQSGHAKWLLWENATVDALLAAIESAVTADVSLIKNDREMRKRNS